MARNNMRIISVPLGERTYNIYIGSNALASLPDLLITADLYGSKAVLVTDENVWASHGESMENILTAAGANVSYIVLPPGEKQKNIKQLAALYDRFAELELDRNSTVLAFGGGVIGDLAGFAAATWMRGINLVQIPTSLLAQVDSSVGGKTAIDIPAGKNLAGAFWQPKLVVIDPELLKTLPDREYSSGMAEVIKYGAIASESLFERLETREKDADLTDVIQECCLIKSSIVAEDELDTGRRLVLNFGHTFGHAIETKYGFSKYNHGEAVAAGMLIAAEIGERLGLTEKGVLARIENLLARYGLDAREDTSGLGKFMKLDKKSSNDGVNLVLLRKIGESFAKDTRLSELEPLL